MKKLVFVFILTVYGLCLYAQKISFSTEEIKWADSMMSSMSLRQKIGQLFMLDYHPNGKNYDRKAYIMKMIETYNLGGVILMKGDYDMARIDVNDFQSVSQVPMYIAIDGEWGINMRLANTLKYPYQMTLGAIRDPKLLYQMGQEIGNECKSVGINVNFAPCVDVNVNPRNPVINFRSFGENVENVIQKATEYALGLQSVGVMTSLKHFPGHGDTDKDSHFELPKINKSIDQLRRVELLPFERIIKRGVWGTMVGHLNVPALDSSGLPASFSRKITKNYLRDTLGFRGIVFSDALNMKGASRSFSSDQSDLEAYKAGNDILEFPANLPIAISKIEEYICQDFSTFEEFHSRVKNILLFKAKIGLSKYKPTSYNPGHTFLNESSPKYKFCQMLYDKAITYISESNTPISYWTSSNTKTLVIKVGSDKDYIIENQLKGDSNFVLYSLPGNANGQQRAKAIEKADSFDRTIVIYKDLNQYASKKFGFRGSKAQIAAELSLLPNTLHIVMGNPYSLKYFQQAKHVIVGYEDNEHTNQSIAKILNRQLTPEGKLPVSIGKFREGNRIERTQIADPEILIPTPAEEATELGEIVAETAVDSVLRSDSLASIKGDIETKIESLVNQMISSGAAPGCQIVALHRGVEIYNKSFGAFTYEPNAKKVSSSDYYDLASVSKILATTISAMKLKDMGKLKIHSYVSDYIPLDSSATISDVTIYELLTHTAGLVPYIPFYRQFNDQNFYQYFNNQKEGRFNVPVAKNLFVREDIRDSMWYQISHSKLIGRGKYEYSDLSMYTMQKVIEKVSGMSLDQFVYKHFYVPMGLRLVYNPLEYGISPDRIAPTENDASFRRQLIQGYVHDQGACLYGGVAGHAGLFGTASDVAKLMQMLMNYGQYQNKRYLQELTIRQFTSQQSENSRRGLGFDRPSDGNSGLTSPLCSPYTFGHTGFTGTCAWADPEHELVFVFLSNRIHPNAENKKLINGRYRQKIHTLIYNMIGVMK